MVLTPSCLQVTGVNILGNNLPGIALRSFIKSTEVWGWPLQVWGDRGGENILVATAVILKRGPREGRAREFS